MKITITIEVGAKGTEAFAQEVHALLPTVEQLKEYRTKIIPAVLPVKFRIEERQTHSAFIEFDD